MATRYLLSAPMMQRFIVTFFRWWVGQLATLLPAGIQRAYTETGDAAILELDGDRVRLLVRRDGFVTPAGEGGLQDLRRLMSSVPDLPQLLFLRVPARQALRKKLSLPSAARRDLKNVLGFEIDRETPFEQAEIYWNYTIVRQDNARGKLDIDLLILPRRIVDPVVETIRRAGLNPSALEIITGTGEVALIWIAAQKRGYWLKSQRKLMPLAVTACGLACGTFLMPFAAQQWHLAAASRAIAAIEPQAREAAALRQSANQRLAAIAFLSRTHGINGSVLAVLVATTRALPDNSFLTSLSLHGGQVTMMGSSESAAGLIGLLTKSTTFRGPEFDAPVVEGEDDDLEKFTISVALASVDAP